MELPIVEYPTFTTDLPSTGQKIKYRPFIVAEEKIFLMALESKDINQMISATKDIVDACTFNKLKIDTLPSFDIEYMLVKLRSKSKGEIIPLKYACTKFITDSNDALVIDEQSKMPIQCGKPKIVKFNLDDVQVVRTKGVADTVTLDETNKIGVKLRYPTFNDIKTTDFKGLFAADPEAATKIIYDSVECIFSGDQMISTKDFTLKEFIAWVDKLPGYMHDKLQDHIQEFHENMPRVVGIVDYTCACGKYNQKIPIEALSSFFV